METTSIWGDKVLKIKRYVISKDEVVESMEYHDGNRMKYYIYSYKIRKGRKLITLVRLDNLDGMEHMDIYDETGNFVETKEFPRKNFNDFVKIVKTFRKNIIAVDITNL